MIDEATIEQIKNASNIVDVVGDYVTLHRAGANYKGLCPFHNERTPSFIVSPAKNYCHCFGCGQGGDPIRFLKELNNYTYREALIHLANKYHIEIKETNLTNEQIAENQKRQAYLTLLDFACNFFKSQLHAENSNAKALDFLNNIGITEKTIAQFNIGFTGESPTALTDAIQNNSHSISHATDLGLVAPMTNGMSDIFQNCITLPIYNKTGKVIGFAFQSIDTNSEIFSITSAKNPVFDPSQALFAYFQAKHAIAKEKSCYLVQTPYDALMMHQSGYENTIAPLGDDIDRYTANDLGKSIKDNSATIIASSKTPNLLRSLNQMDTLLAQGINVFGYDILSNSSLGETINLCSNTEFNNKLNTNKKDCITFKIETMQRLTGDSPEAKLNAIHSALKSIKIMRNETSKQIYLSVLSSITSIDINMLSLEMGNL